MGKKITTQVTPEEQAALVAAPADEAEQENNCGNCATSAAWTGPEDEDAPEACMDCCHLNPLSTEDRWFLFASEELEFSVPSYTLPEGAKQTGEDTITAIVPLDEDEREACGKRMADALCVKARLEDELDIFRKGINGQIKEQEAEALNAARLFHNGKEERRVQCLIISDYNTVHMRYVEKNFPYREVFARPMTEEERQMPLPLEPETQARLDAFVADGQEDAPAPRTCGTCAVPHSGEGDESCTDCDSKSLPNWRPADGVAAGTEARMQ